jgi:DnaJ-class molecular chaperone
MYKLNAEDALPEVKCPACGGTGFPKVRQPMQTGRRIYPATCKECLGKGRLAIEAK